MVVLIGRSQPHGHRLPTDCRPRGLCFGRLTERCGSQQDVQHWDVAVTRVERPSRAVLRDALAPISGLPSHVGESDYNELVGEIDDQNFVRELAKQKTAHRHRLRRHLNGPRLRKRSGMANDCPVFEGQGLRECRTLASVITERIGELLPGLSKNLKLFRAPLRMDEISSLISSQSCETAVPSSRLPHAGRFPHARRPRPLGVAMPSELESSATSERSILRVSA